MNICYLLANGIHRFRARRGRQTMDARTTDDAAYWKWQFDSSADYFAKFFDLESRLIDAEVIDIGCGLGGRTCYLATRGVRNIVGTDINHAEIDRAVRLAQHDSAFDSKTSFAKVHEEDSIQRDKQFDVALLVDSLEHARNPVALLNLAYSHLKPGGICYFSTWGWYHHQASHVGSIVPIPFSTVLFSDRQILDAVRRIVDQPYYRRTNWDSAPPSARWQGVNSLRDRPGEYLNKYTIANFEKSMKESEFDDATLRVEGFSAKRHPLLAVCNFLTRVPGVREIYHSAIFGRLVKADSRPLQGFHEQPASERRMAI